MVSIAGIHFGPSRICVSAAEQFPFHIKKLCEMPASCSFTPTGEILTGNRAMRYRTIHRDAPYYSVFRVLQHYGWKPDYSITEYGFSHRLDEILAALMGEIRRELGENTFEKYIVSLSDNCFQSRELLAAAMSVSGMQLFRVLSTAEACLLTKLHTATEETVQAVCAMEGGSISGGSFQGAILSMACIEAEDGFLENLYTLDRPYDAALGTPVAQCRHALEQKEITTSAIHCFSDRRAVIEFAREEGEVRAVEVTAASGCAILGGAVNGATRLNRLLLLEREPAAYGVLPFDAQGRAVRPLTWLLPEQTTFPADASTAFDDAPLAMEDWCELQVFTRTWDGAQLQIGSIRKKDLGKLTRLSRSLRCKLVLDTDRNLSCTLSVEDHEETETFSISTPVDRLPQPPQPAETSLRRVLKSVEHELSTFAYSLDGLSKQEKASPVTAGLQQIRKQCDRFLAKWNYRKLPDDPIDRSSRTVKDVLGDLLEITDNLEYGLRSKYTPEEMGIRTLTAETYRALQRILLIGFDVRPIPAEGTAFDPNLHEAMEHTTDENLGAELVLREQLRGYYSAGRVSRPSRVCTVN